MSLQHEVFSNPRLLQIPIKRAAWSDRTALLMAEMSRLAYYEFEKDGDGNVMPQADLDGVLERLLAPDGEVAVDTPSDGGDADQPPALPAGAVRLKEDLARAGFEIGGLFSDEGTDTQAFLAVSGAGTGIRPFGDEEVAVLSFRGTRTIKDWINNAKVFQKSVKGAQVHSGFQGAFDAVRPAVQGKIDPLIGAGRTLYLTGHSLGGALALIATREMGSDSYGACYTFGSPRVGRFGFARDIKTPIYRVVNANDLVPRVPPAYLPSLL
ncbi:MAG: lipase family protein, partial [Chloroflexi bacterium]|nr:lipase family protein [Chloroflexota bacterium]